MIADAAAEYLRYRSFGLCDEVSVRLAEGHRRAADVHARHPDASPERLLHETIEATLEASEERRSGET